MKIYLTMLIFMNIICFNASAEDFKRFPVQIAVMDEKECLNTYVNLSKYSPGNVWNGLMWDEEKKMCYAEISTAFDNVKVYITKDYHLIVEEKTQ